MNEMLKVRIELSGSDYDPVSDGHDEPPLSMEHVWEFQQSSDQMNGPTVETQMDRAERIVAAVRRLITGKAKVAVEDGN